MYVPPMYKSVGRGWIRQVMRRYPLATLVTNGPSVPYATHLPVIFAPGGEADPEGEKALDGEKGLDSEKAPDADDLAGTTLLGHMNRANPHWGSLSDAMDAKLIFTGPHSYVTPTIYEQIPAAPTWNFVAAHVEGTLRLLPDFEDTLRVVRATVTQYERDFGDGWQMDESLDYFRMIGPAVGAFRFEVRSAHAMFKLSQEKDTEIQRRVADRFATESGSAHELALLMREFSLAGE
ncbi:hypothetical protein GCM10010252_77530 [Streptomyces aureoverticillatus]|nr:Lyd13 [Streptomyces sp.]GGS27116.1 hypothetical protein GCM10010252_77530 [Streptomyces aureoverticillatus]